MIGTEQGSKALMAQSLELFPFGPADVAFQDCVPHLSRAGEVVGCEPDPIRAASLLAMEKLLTLEQPAKRILLAITGGEGQLMLAGNSRALGLQQEMRQLRRRVHRGRSWRRSDPCSLHDG